MLPPTASRPTSPEPGSTSRSSSVNTFVFGSDRESCRLLLGAGCADRPGKPDAFARAERVEAHEVAALHEPVLHLRRPHHAGADDELQRTEVVRRALGFGLLERAQHRLSERVADDRHLGDALALHGGPQLVRIEVAADERADRGTQEHRLEAAERPGAVHERRRGQVHAVRARVDERFARPRPSARCRRDAGARRAGRRCRPARRTDLRCAT